MPRIGLNVAVHVSCAPVLPLASLTNHETSRDAARTVEAEQVYLYRAQANFLYVNVVVFEVESILSKLPRHFHIGHVLPRSTPSTTSILYNAAYFGEIFTSHSSLCLPEVDGFLVETIACQRLFVLSVASGSTT
jgi:hypothetical protein